MYLNHFCFTFNVYIIADLLSQLKPATAIWGTQSSSHSPATSASNSKARWYLMVLAALVVGRKQK